MTYAESLGIHSKRGYPRLSLLPCALLCAIRICASAPRPRSPFSLPHLRGRLLSSRPSTSPQFSLRAKFNPWPTPVGMSWQNVLENYAKMKDPRKEMPNGVFLMRDEKTLTIFDGYEKAKYHFLVMVSRYPFELPASPKSKVALRASDLSSLSSLLQSPHTLEVLKALEVTGKKVKEMIEDEMMKNEGWKWGVQIGFHAAESMKHVHLHVISSDLISPKLKNKKHYNSFHPKLGFFLHLNEVISEVESGNVSKRSASSYETILKEPLVSVYNGKEYSNIPKLKQHLEEVWVMEGKKAKQAVEAKRKADDEDGDGEDPKKKPKQN